jgi:NAD(P)-dependent dehydrogenase (short-subunit alcohol dehydrogenase family)
VLAAAGATIIGWDVDDKGLNETKGLIEEAGGTVIVDVVEVGNEASVRDGVAKAARIVERIDVLINNAGVSSKPVRIHELPSADWDRLMSVNLTGTFLCSKYVLPTLLKQRAGSIINISSILGMVGFYPGISVVGAAYSASKTGIDGFTRQLAAEYASENIRCNSVAPGFHVGTNLGKERRAAASKRSNEMFLSSVLSRTPFNRLGVPEDMFGLIIYLSSDASKYVTGQSFALDGGWTAT